MLGHKKGDWGKVPLWKPLSSQRKRKVNLAPMVWSWRRWRSRDERQAAEYASTHPMPVLKALQTPKKHSFLSLAKWHLPLLGTRFSIRADKWREAPFHTFSVTATYAHAISSGGRQQKATCKFSSGFNFFILDIEMINLQYFLLGDFPSNKLVQIYKLKIDFRY